MKPIGQSSDEELSFVANDCSQAISAMPDNKKVPEYYHLMNECINEIYQRKRLRAARRDIKGSVFDKLQSPIRKRRLIRNSGYDFDRFRSACWLLGYYKRYGSI